MIKNAINTANARESYPELVFLYIGLESTVLEASAARERAIDLLSEHFPSFTVTDGAGFFRGTREPVLVATIAVTNPGSAVDVAGKIRTALQQDGVGIAFRGRYHRITADLIPRLSEKEESHA